MPGTFLNSGETDKVDMIPEVQELIVAMRQTNGCIQMWKVWDMRRDLQYTMEEKGCLGKTESTMKTSEKQICLRYLKKRTLTANSFR